MGNGDYKAQNWNGTIKMKTPSNIPRTQLFSFAENCDKNGHVTTDDNTYSKIWRSLPGTFHNAHCKFCYHSWKNKDTKLSLIGGEKKPTTLQIREQCEIPLSGTSVNYLNKLNKVITMHICDHPPQNQCKVTPGSFSGYVIII